MKSEKEFEARVESIFAAGLARIEAALGRAAKEPAQSKVFVLVAEIDYSPSEVIGVYATREIAEVVRKMQRPISGGEYVIYEEIVRSEPTW